MLPLVSAGLFSPLWTSCSPQLASSDTFMSKTARLYQDTRNVAGGSNLDKLNDELQDVTRIMTKNMEELLWRGDSLDRKFTPTSCVPCHLILSLQGCRTCRRHCDPSLKSTVKRHITSISRQCFDNMLRWLPSCSSCSSSYSGNYRDEFLVTIPPLFVVCSAMACTLC